MIVMILRDHFSPTGVLGCGWFDFGGNVEEAANADGLRGMAAIEHEYEIAPSGPMAPDAGVDESCLAVHHGGNLNR